MKKSSFYRFIFIVSFILTTTGVYLYAQEKKTDMQEISGISRKVGETNKDSIKLDEKRGIISSLRFKDADIRIVLNAIAEKSTVQDSQGNIKKVNIVVSPQVTGFITVKMENVHWLTALEAILKSQGYDYEWVGDNVILVDTLERLAEKREKEMMAKEQEPLETRAYRLKYLDANDVKKVIEPQLGSRGKISVLEIEPQKGWKARGGYGAGGGGGGETTAKAEREKGAKPRSDTLVITDTKTNIRKIFKVIEKMDVMPRQVLIEARIMEVSRDLLRDIGFDYGTGSTGVTGGTTSQIDLTSSNDKNAGGFIKSDVTPSNFSPSASDISGEIPYTAGLEFIFRKLTGAEFEAILHALEEDVNTNTLSAPRIVTLDGQEAYIMVGEKKPIIKSDIESSQTSVGISKELDYYQNLGIELNVVPQISDDNYVNLILYPSVTSSSGEVSATSQIGSTTSTDSYPIIKVRELQTQILMKDGETIAIGGLLKDVKSEGVIKVPILGDIPIIGKLFQRKTHDTEKIDLIIFLTVKILNPGEEMPDRVLQILNAREIKEKFDRKNNRKRRK